MAARAILFDLDGTLADTLADIASAANRVLAARGLPTHPIASYRPWIGEGVIKLMARAHPPAPEVQVAEAVAEFRRDYAAHMLDATAPYPGIPELLEQLTARPVPIAVLSNKPDSATTAMVARLFPRVAFRAVVGLRAGGAAKPDPTSALAIARDAFAVPPDRCALVGDTATDMATAVAAGMIPVGVAWGFRDADQLFAAGARHLIAEPAALLDLL